MKKRGDASQGRVKRATKKGMVSVEHAQEETGRSDSDTNQEPPGRKLWSEPGVTTSALLRKSEEEDFPSPSAETRPPSDLRGPIEIRNLARAILKHIDLNSAGVIVELGPQSPSLRATLIELGIEKSRFVFVQPGPLSRKFSITVPKLVSKHIRSEAVGPSGKPIEAVISTVLATIGSPEMRLQVAQTLFSQMARNAPIIEYGSATVLPLPDPCEGIRLDASEQVGTHIPLSRVWVYRRISERAPASKSGIAPTPDTPLGFPQEQQRGDLISDIDPAIGGGRDSSVSALIEQILDREGIESAESRAAIAADFRRTLARAKAEVTGRPRWRDRAKHTDLANLSAPKFLVHVHADDIQGNTVHKEAIRPLDPELIAAVESYISKRKSRGVNLGDAEGLTFIASQPARNKVSREVRLRKKFGKDAGRIAEGMREIERTRTRSHRARKRRLMQPK